MNTALIVAAFAVLVPGCASALFFAIRETLHPHASQMPEDER